MAPCHCSAHLLPIHDLNLKANDEGKYGAGGVDDEWSYYWIATFCVYNGFCTTNLCALLVCSHLLSLHVHYLHFNGSTTTKLKYKLELLKMRPQKRITQCNGWTTSIRYSVTDCNWETVRLSELVSLLSSTGSTLHCFSHTVVRFVWSFPVSFWKFLTLLLFSITSPFSCAICVSDPITLCLHLYFIPSCIHIVRVPCLVPECHRSSWNIPQEAIYPRWGVIFC